MLSYCTRRRISALFILFGLCVGLDSKNSFDADSSTEIRPQGEMTELSLVVATNPRTPGNPSMLMERNVQEISMAPEEEKNEDWSGDELPSGVFVVPLHLLGILSYLCLLGWFSNRMKQGEYQNTIEEWIGRTIAVGLCAVVLRCLEYLLFDHTGDRHPFVAGVTAFGYAAKHGLTRALLVGLSTGVGMLPSRLGLCTLILLVAVTIFYIAVVTGLDYWAFATDHRENFNRDDDSIRLFLLAAKASMEIIFWCWMWCALCRTISDLRAINRPSQDVFRYRSLFWILMLLAVLSGAVFAAVITEKTDYGSVGLASNRGLSQLDEVCVFFMLLAAAILWRPRLQLPATTGNDLELIQSMTESNPDIPEDSPLFKADSTFG